MANKRDPFRERKTTSTSRTKRPSADGGYDEKINIPLEPDGCLPQDPTPKQRMACKVRTKKGRETCAKRKGMIELIFSQIKQARGFRQFLLRGVETMRGAWSLVCMTHNLLTLFEAQQQAMI